LLGQFQLEFGSEAVELCRNGQRMMAFMGLRGRVSRTVLAGTLWPEVSEEHARGSLRTTLWKLPRGNPPLIRCCGDYLVITAAVHVDVHSLAETALGPIQECDPPLNGGPTLAMLSGEDLLPGWDEDWVLLERERLRQLRLHALDAASAASPSAKAPIELPSRRISPREISRREISPKRYVTITRFGDCCTRKWASSPLPRSPVCSRLPTAANDAGMTLG
jgi:hypothetical protein